jgi:hypothetical protein
MNKQLSLFDEEYQPRFQLYLDHGNSLEEFKKKPWLYMLWVSKKWQEFMKEHGIKDDRALQDRFGDKFDEWLRSQIKVNTETLNWR